MNSILRPTNQNQSEVGVIYWIKSIYNYLVFYSTNCVIHCVQYMARSSLTKCERALWFLIIILSEVLCIHFAIPAINRYYNHNSYISLERDFYLWNTSLPSATICPLHRINREKFNNYFSDKDLSTENAELLFDFLEHLANSTYFNLNQFPAYNISLDNLLDDLNIIPNNYMELIYNLTIDYTQYIGEQYRVQSFFDLEKIKVRQILTEYGICYLANSYLNLKYSSYYSIFAEFPNNSEKIQNAITEDPAVSVLQSCFFDKDVIYSFVGFEKAIDVYVHSPYEIMKIDNNFGKTEMGLHYAVLMEEIIVEDAFRKASIQQRHCRFESESNLTHFPIYTEKLCHQECRLNYVYNLCKCIPHFYPNRFSKPKPVCHYKELLNCVNKNSDAFLKLYNKDNPEEIINCYCQPNCIDAVLNILSIESIESFQDLSGSLGIMIMMASYPTIRFKRQLMFTFSNLLVYIGSLAGFFMGFNVLAALEFIYFFTLRLLLHIIRHRHL